MFFYISGMGATYFNTEGKGFFLFTWNKTLRLLVPFVIAIFVFLIPRLYFGQPYDDWCRPDKENMENLYDPDFDAQKVLEDIDRTEKKWHIILSEKTLSKTSCWILA